MRERWWRGLCAVGLLLGGLSTSAEAQTCEQSSDCQHGYSCEVVGGSSCPGVACRPGEKCEQPKCEPTVIRGCVPAPCNVDRDCASGMVCHENPPACSVSGGTPAVAPCPPGEKCPEVKPAPPVTTCSEPTRTCTPRYALPCQQASDCGSAGWECQAVEECSCSGSAGSPTPQAEPRPDPGAPVPPMKAPPSDGFAAARDAGAAEEMDPAAPKPAMDGGVDQPRDAAPRESCECRTSDIKSCRPIPKDCMADGDCPTDFTCQRATADRPASGGGCTASRDGGMSECWTDPAPPAPAPETVVGKCYPKDYGTLRGGTPGVSMPTSGSSQNKPESPVAQPSPPAADGNGNGGVPTSADAGTGAESGEAHDDASDEDMPITPKCSIRDAGLSSSSAFGWIVAAFGFAWLRRRRG